MSNIFQDIESIIANTEYYYITNHVTPRKRKVSPVDIVRSDFSMELEDIPDTCFGDDFFSFHDGDEDAVNRVCSRISRLPTSVPFENVIYALPKHITNYTITTLPSDSNTTVQHASPCVVENTSALSTRESRSMRASNISVVASSLSSTSAASSNTTTSAYHPSTHPSSPTRSTSATFSKAAPVATKILPSRQPQNLKTLVPDTTNTHTNHPAPDVTPSIAFIRAIRREGATIRSGPDIDNSSVIDRLQYGEVAGVLCSQLLQPSDDDCVAVTRICIRLERGSQTIEGWVSLTGRTVQDNQPIVEYITTATPAATCEAPKSQLVETCPICDYVFASHAPLRDREIHVNECLAKLDIF